MDFKKFGAYLLIVGIVLCIAGLVGRYQIAPYWKKAEEGALVVRYYSGESTSEIRAEIDEIRSARLDIRERVLWLAFGGAGVVLLGLGLFISAAQQNTRTQEEQ